MAHYEFQVDLTLKKEVEERLIFAIGRPSCSLSSNYLKILNFFGSIGGYEFLAKFTSLTIDSLTSNDTDLNNKEMYIGMRRTRLRQALEMMYELISFIPVQKLSGIHNDITKLHSYFNVYSSRELGASSN